MQPGPTNSMYNLNGSCSITPWMDALMTRRKLSSGIVDQAHGFPYSRRLDAHKSCVNALKFSSGEGRFLASGGDDMRICLWDFYQEDVKEPSYSLKGPRGNIFAIEFSATNKYLFTGGSSEVVLKYDVGTLGSTVECFTNSTPNQLYDDYRDSIRAITCHPTQDEIFLSVSEDGAIRRQDVRRPNRPLSEQEVIQMEQEISGAQYHPRMEHLFITSDSKGNVLLWDARMAFTRKDNEGVVQRYHTRLTRQSERHACNPESSSVVFDKDGVKFAVTYLNYLPTLYVVTDPDPIAVLSATKLPDGLPIPSGQRTYSNACTTKHGAFGGPGDENNLYAAGSDNFRGYIWKIPPTTLLIEQRQKFSAEEWLTSHSGRIAFTDDRKNSMVVPVEIETPLCWLTGHNSIVNTIAFHPHFLHVVTAGVEKRLVLHSPTPSSPCAQDMALSPTSVRELTDESSEEDSFTYMIAVLGMHSMDPENADDNEERRTLSLFDHLLRNEGEVDVFSARALKDSSSSESSDSESDGDHSMEDGSDEDVLADK